MFEFLPIFSNVMLNGRANNIWKRSPSLSVLRSQMSRDDLKAKKVSTSPSDEHLNYSKRLVMYKNKTQTT